MIASSEKLSSPGRRIRASSWVSMRLLFSRGTPFDLRKFMSKSMLCPTIVASPIFSITSAITSVKFLPFFSTSSGVIPVS